MGKGCFIIDTVHPYPTPPFTPTIQHTLGGLKGYSAEKCMSRKNTPPSYTDPGGPRMVDTHSYKLSPLGPALQFGGGSSVISASSFCILLKVTDYKTLHFMTQNMRDKSREKQRNPKIPLIKRF